MLDFDNLQKSRDPKTGSGHLSQSDFTAPEIYLTREAALQDFDRETESAPKRNPPEKGQAQVAVLMNNARVLMKHSEYSLALNLLRAASNHNSKNIQVLNLLSECLEQTLRFEEALKVRSASVRLECTFDQVQRLATLSYKMGKDEDALRQYYEALSLLTEEDGAIFDVYKNMGNILVRQGDFEGAEDCYNKAYTLNPDSDVLLVNFGTLEVQRQDFDKSLYCFRRAVEINPKNDKAWVGLALVHARFGDSELARANLGMAVEINPGNRTAVLLMANWCLRDRRESQGIDALQEYLSRVEFDEEISLVLINLYCGNSQINEARLECERVLLWNPQNAEVASLRAKLKNIKKA